MKAKCFFKLIGLTVAINLFIFFSHNVMCQLAISDFEDVNLPTDSVWKGVDSSGGYTSGDAFFVNHYNAGWDAWEGFACSAKSDTLTAGFQNQFSAIAGSGYGGSKQYAVAYTFTPAVVRILPVGPPNFIEGFYICNSTYGYLSMKNGDTYAKKFGGTSGMDPDWFKLNILCYRNGIITDTTDFYLADYRFSDSTKDYIVKEWTWVNVSQIIIDSLTFWLSSSDTGAFGMNTPAFFCMDNFTISYLTGFKDMVFNEINSINVFYDPIGKKIIIQNNYNKNYLSKAELFDLSGKRILVQPYYTESGTSLPVEKLAKGFYILRLNNTTSIKVGIY